MPSQTRNIIFDDELQYHIRQALAKVYTVASASYGPKAGIALIEQPYGAPTASRDGVTNIKKVYLDDPTENMVAAVVKMASEENNRKVGDGTTAVAILTWHLYSAAMKKITGGHNRMEVSERLGISAKKVITQLNELSVPVDKKILRSVAEVAVGNEGVGQMIADVIDAVGVDGGVTLEDFKGVGIIPEIVDGFYFRKGYTNINLINDPTNLESHHVNVPILITEKKLLTTPDIADVLEKIVGAGIKDLIIVGEISDEALAVLLLNRMKGKINSCVVDLPFFAGTRSMIMEDLAILTGGKVYLPGSEGKDFSVDMLGVAERVDVTGYSTAIIGADGSKEEVAARIEEIQKQLKEATHPGDVEAIKDRLARMTGKVAIIRVGGATDIEQQETKLRVEDAVCAVQAAIRGGVCPGGGVALARVKGVEFEDAFKEPLKQLMSNAGLNPEKYLARVETAKPWHGYNIKALSENPIDLLKSGVVDPTDVLKEVVLNATSIVSKLVTATTGITYQDRDSKHE
jgi:chaperonin GroEL